MTEAEAEVEAARITARERQYSTYVEWAEKLIERRAEANRFYISLNLAIVGALGLLLKDGVEGLSPVLVGLAMAAIAAAGVAVSLNWRAVIASQRRVAATKFEVIHALEEGLPTRPYFEEWRTFAPAREKKVSISRAEGRLPLLFLVFYVIGIVGIDFGLVVQTASLADACGGVRPMCIAGRVLSPGETSSVAEAGGP